MSDLEKEEINIRDMNFHQKTSFFTANQKKLYDKFHRKKYKIEQTYKSKMLSASREFELNKSIEGFNESDCRLIYQETKVPVEKWYDRQMTCLQDWYEKEKEKLK